MCDLSANAYQLLSRPLSNIELLCRLSPMADSDQAQVDILVHIIDMISDYSASMRHILDDLGSHEGQP